MGKPKAWLPFGDELMLPRVVRILREVVEPVVVVAAQGQDIPPLPEEVQIVRDEVEGRGPLGGLAAGLAALEGKADAAYLSSCDVPLLRSEFVRRVVEMLEEPTPPGPPSLKGRGEFSKEEPESETSRRGFISPLPFREGGPGGVGLAPSAAVPFVGGRLHPLAAAYRVVVLPAVREMLAAGNFRMTDLLQAIPSRIIDAEELMYTDPKFLSLRNLNTPDEYAAALRELRAVD